MSKASFGEGAVIEIPDGLIADLGKFDRYLESIAKSSKAINATGFQALMTALNGMKTGNVESLERFAAALEKLGKTNVGAAAQNVAQGVNSVGAAAQKTATSVTTMNTSLSQTVQQLNGLQAARPFQNLNITQLNDQISNIKTLLGRQGKDIKVDGEVVGQYPTFTKQEQQALVNKQRLYEQELKIQQTAESAKIASIERVAKAQNVDLLNQQKNDERELQSHLKAMEQRTAAAQAQSAKLRQMSEQEVQETIKNAQRARQAQTAVPSVAAGSSYFAYDNIGKQVAQLEQRQQTLNKTVKEYELTMQRIQSGKGGVVTVAQQKEVEAARQELEANKQTITALRQKQQAIVDANMAYQQSRQIVESLKTAEQQRNSLPNQRSQQTLAEMRKYYTELEKTSAQAAAQAERDARRKQAAEEKAAQASQKAWERAEQERQRISQMQRENTSSYQARQRSLNSTFAYSSAMSASRNANTLGEEIAAVSKLKEARLALDKTDTQYLQKMRELNAAIKQHEQNLRQAGVQSQQLAGRHRNLMDISGQLARQLALMFSVSQVEGYINQIAKIRGEFELQQRSLEAILQNKTQADAIFQKTVDLAIKSPFSIRQLVRYTKQLAAYRIESDSLYDTTKRLADVSAGLGVDMQRLILAYGQVKAAAYLRGTEVRQFTEAGVNMYGELQSYFQEVKGEAYTTAQIVDMISKRKVTFEDVEAVFKRLTDQGGLFYNMQEIQSETLQGKIMNLKDSLDVMMNSIGEANEGTLKGVVDTMRVLAEHWETLAAVLKNSVAVFAALKVQALLASDWIKLLAIDYGVLTTTVPKALTVTQAFTVGLRALKTALVSVGRQLATFLTSHPYIVAMVAAGTAVVNFVSASRETSKALDENNREFEKSARKIGDIVRAFGQLRDVAARAKEQKNTGFDFDKNFDEQKQQLSQLYKLMEENRVIIPVELGEVSKENIAETFSKAKEKLMNDERMKLDIENFIDTDDNAFFSNVRWGLGIGDVSLATFGHINDSFSVQMQDAEDAANAMREWGTAAESVLNSVGAHYDELTPKAKAAYDSVHTGAKEGEPDAVYLQRVAQAWVTIRDEMQATTDWADKANSDTWTVLGGSMAGAADDMVVQQQKAVDEINAMLDDLISKNRKRLAGMSDEDKLSFFNAVAEKQKFSEYQTWLLLQAASTKVGFKVELDKDDMAAQIDWAKKNLRDSLEGMRLHINLDMNLDEHFLDSVFDQVDEAQKFLKNVAKYKAFTSGGRERKVTWGEVKKDSEFTSWYSKNYKMTPLSDSYELSDKELNAFIKAQEKKARATIKASNQEVEADKKANKQKADAAAKAERDIWSERIAVLKEMQGRYENVRELMGDDAAAANVRAAYAEALKNVNMGAVMKAEDIVPTKAGIVKALEKVLSAMPGTMKDYFKKSQDLKKTIAELKIGIDKERLEKSLEEAKRMVEDAFTGLDLYKKLKDAGLGESIIKQMFPDISKNFDEMQAHITAAYAEKFPEGEYLKEGTKQYEQYHDELRNLDKKRVQDQRDTLIELVKNYKDKVTELASIDAWYYSEKAKIAASEATPDLKIELNRNLDTEKDKRKGEAMWNEFKNSESYGTLFSDLENQSTATLDRLKRQLDMLRDSMSNLDPTQMKEVMEAYEKLDEAASERSPLRSLVEDLKKIKELKAQGITEESLDKTIADNDAENYALEQKISAMTRMVEIKRQGGAQSADDGKFIQNNLRYYGETAEELERMITVKKGIIASNKKENAAAKQTKNTYAKARKDQQKTKEVIGELLQKALACGDAAKEMADALGASDTTQAIMDIVMQLAEGIVQIYLFAIAWKVAGVEMKASMGIIGYILIALEAVIGIFTALFKMHDNRLQNKIEDLEDEVELLAEAYDKLKDAMDAAWTTENLEKYTHATKANVQAQIAYYEQMIALEEAKKKTDKDKISDWQKEIRELKDTLTELTESEIEAAGGFGSDENIQDAAQAFADAWVDAFNEGEDALDALNDKWDEYVANLVKKQAMLRVVGAAMEPLLKKVDEYVSESSEGGLKLTQNELDDLQERADALLPGLNESLKDLLETMNYTGGSTEDNLDALEQGIEGVSEETAAALESILNSMRFFLATQQGDVAAIRTILEGRFGLAGTAAASTAGSLASSSEESGTSGSNPMLTELRAQTGYLKKLSDNFEGCFTFSQQSKGKGLRVFVQ